MPLWTVQIRTRLDSEQKVTEFQVFQEEFRRNTSVYLGPFSERIRKAVSRAANATGRPMSATNFTASTTIQEVPRRWGIVTFEFRWNGFAERRDGRLVVGDVFRGGFFLATNDTLELAVPEGYEVSSVEPPPDEQETGSLVWHGREDFSDEHPLVVFTAIEPAGTAETESPGTTSTTSGGAGLLAGGNRPLALIIGGLVLLGLITLGAYWLWRRRSGDIGGSVGTGPPDPAQETGTVQAVPKGADEHVLTDAERVQQTLEAHGGRLKQAALGDELDWSASKISRVVSDMVDDGTVEKLQLGRENLVELSDDE